MLVYICVLLLYMVVSASKVSLLCSVWILCYHVDLTGLASIDMGVIMSTQHAPVLIMYY